MVVVGIHTAYKNEFSIMLILLGMLYSRRNPKQYLGIFDFEKEMIALVVLFYPDISKCKILHLSVKFFFA